MSPESIDGITFPAEVRALVESALAGVDAGAATALVAGTIGPPPLEDQATLPEAA